MRKKNHLEDLTLERRVILKTGVQEIKWIDLAQLRDRLNALVNGVIKFPVP